MTQTLIAEPHGPARAIGGWVGSDDLAALQAARLPVTLERAARSPFYRRRWNGSRPEHLGQVGLTTKQDLRDAYPFDLLAVPRDRLATYHESSGTGGTPTSSYYTEEDWDDLTERYARKWVGIHPSDVFLVRTPYALMVTGHLAQAAARRCGATVVPGDNRSLAMPYARVVRILHDLDVTLTWSLPTETLLWAAAARAAGLEPRRDFPALRALFVGGEPLSAARRSRIEDIWGVPVVEEYGSTETGSLAGQCPQGRMHLWADRAIFEVHDARTGSVGPTGRGELVVTPLYREAMPLVRYNIADDVDVSYAPCPCGWHLPTVRVLGRSAFGYPVAGVPVTQARLEELVFGLPARHGVMFWRARAEADRLRVEIEVAGEHGLGACAELATAIGNEYGIPAEVVTVPRDRLIPTDVLTRTSDVVKPRSLFGPGEDWDSALLYY
jgi:phenylacetate-CoA ligase